MVIILNQIFIIILSLLLLVGGVNLKGGYINDKFSKSIYEKYQVTIYRDTWGVPHIFGEKEGERGRKEGGREKRGRKKRKRGGFYKNMPFYK